MKKRIVIAGLGDTGLLVALNLPTCYEVIGISTKPCLVSGQELGTRLAHPHQWKKNYLLGFDRFRKLAHVTTLHGTITSTNPQAQNITLTDLSGMTSTIHYDVLVIASGVTNGFWRNNTLEDVNHINQSIQQHADTLAHAQTIAIVGGGAAGVSAASNIKEAYPNKDIHLFFSQDLPLPGYHQHTRQFINRYLHHQGIHLHQGHRAILPNTHSILEGGEITWQTSQTPFYSDATLWAVGNIKPNNAFIPHDLLNEDGFVKTNRYLFSPHYSNIFTIGDIAASDPNRSSARNAGFLIVAHNIDCYLNNQAHKMKPYKASQYRWGSILGLQKNGLRIFTSTGSSINLKPCLVLHILFPLIVRKWIYKGIKSDNHRK